MKNQSRPIGIILAAGESNRFGKPKGLIPWKDMTLLEWQIQSLVNFGIPQPVVVLGRSASVYQEEIEALNPFAKILVNGNSEKGPFSSLIIALEASTDNENGFLIVPLDTPIESLDLLKTIVDKAYSEKSDIEAVVPQYQSRGGHPIWISSHFAGCLLKLPLESAESRLDTQLHGLPISKIRRIEWKSQEILLNINSPADLNN